MLAGLGHVYSAQEDSAIKSAHQSCQKINRDMMVRSRSTGDLSFLASPVTGGGITVPRFHQLFLLAAQQGKPKPEEWAQYVWQVLAVQGQSILKDGKALATPEENLAELNEQAQAFSNKHLPILKALGVA